MRARHAHHRLSRRILGLAGVLVPMWLQQGIAQDLTTATLIEKERVVEWKSGRKASYSTAEVGKQVRDFEFMRALDKSRGVIAFPREKGMRLRENTEIRILSLLLERDDVFEIRKGEVYLHSRTGWNEVGIRAGETRVEPRGTQFVLRVDDDGTLTVRMLEGTATVSNPRGSEKMAANEQVEVRPGQAPRKVAGIAARNVVQWYLYYPAVLHVPEIGLSEAEQAALARSIAAYDRGDLLTALDAWPAGYRPRSDAARIYRAMVVLAVGEVDEAQAVIRSVPRDTPGRAALETMIDAVTYSPAREAVLTRAPKANALLGPARRSVSEWLAASYWEQSRLGAHSLERAVQAATKAWQLSQEGGKPSGYAAVRIAEIRFAQGRNLDAQRWLDRGLQLTPRNAQGLALRGFILSGQNRLAEALATFERAIEYDSALGNAWLGRGLCKFRQGQQEEGRSNIRTAMMLEPNRALLHSYLGKAALELGLIEAGMQDLAFARQLDPKDPTPWLYSALARQEQNRPNEAIADLHRALDNNDNRALYRSRFLLDQDRAVRSANLAQLYQHNGMDHVAVREAARAVESDYTNASAHLFLANAYDSLRDPNRFELRYETPWFHELLMANMLSPVGGGRLSQFVSQHEYSKLFESDGLQASLLQELRSNGELRSTASSFGTYGRTSFGVDVHYRSDSGDRINSHDRRLEVYGQLKHEVTPSDTVYLLGKWLDQESGDTRKLYDPADANAGQESEERQEPGLLLAGWNHRWGPDSNTLFLGGRLSARQDLSSPSSRQRLLWRKSANGLVPGFLNLVDGEFRYTDPQLQAAQVTGHPPISGGGQALSYSPELLRAIGPFLGSGDLLDARSAPFDFFTQREFEIYSAEIQHIQKVASSTILLGGRLQVGEIDSLAELNVLRERSPGGGFSTPAAMQSMTSDFERASIYAYDYWSVLPWLTLVGGASWDHIERPENFRNPPLGDRQVDDEQFSLKAAVTLTPWKWFNLRAMYAEALGGLSFDESVTLEPVQLAGFNQAYRTAISESLVGSVEAPEFTVWGLSTEGMLTPTTWWGVSLQSIEQDVDRTVGAFTGYRADSLFPGGLAFFADGTRQQLAYREHSVEATINQLLGDQFAVGALYRRTRSELQSRFPEIPVSILKSADLQDAATLHELSLFANWSSPSGLFARVELNSYVQDLDDDPNGLPSGAPPRTGDEFWQLNAMLGYRLPRNRGEISLGILNINDTDYRLSPLNPYYNIPRERTGVLQCRMSF